MALSKKKYQRTVLQERQDKVNVRSLDGRGYFMDSTVETNVKKYLETGDENVLNRIPDYRQIRGK